MLYALNTETRENIGAIKGISAICPGCELPVIARIGSVVIPHWAHQKNSNCSYSEGETPWHLEWKARFPKENCEIRMGNHRADVFINNVVLEFQSVTPDINKIQAREGFYKEMYWIYKYHNKPVKILNTIRELKTLPVYNKYGISQLTDEMFENDYMVFYKDLYEMCIEIKHPPIGWMNAKSKIFIDLGHIQSPKKTHIDGYMFFIRRHENNFKTLYGQFISYTDFINYTNNNINWQNNERFKKDEKKFLHPKYWKSTYDTNLPENVKFPLYERIREHLTKYKKQNSTVYVNAGSEQYNPNSLFVYFIDQVYSSKYETYYLNRILGSKVELKTLFRLIEQGIKLEYLPLSPTEYDIKANKVNQSLDNNELLSNWLTIIKCSLLMNISSWQLSKIVNYKNVVILYDEDKDDRILEVIDQIEKDEPENLLELIVAHEHEGTVSLLWKKFIPAKQFTEDEGFSMSDGDDFTIQLSKVTDLRPKWI